MSTHADRIRATLLAMPVDASGANMTCITTEGTPVFARRLGFAEWEVQTDRGRSDARCDLEGAVAAVEKEAAARWPNDARRVPRTGFVDVAAALDACPVRFESTDVSLRGETLYRCIPAEGPEADRALADAVGNAVKAARGDTIGAALDALDRVGRRWVTSGPDVLRTLTEMRAALEALR
jgi:hypothetical protein